MLSRALSIVTAWDELRDAVGYPWLPLEKRDRTLARSGPHSRRRSQRPEADPFRPHQLLSLSYAYRPTLPLNSQPATTFKFSGKYQPQVAKIGGGCVDGVFTRSKRDYSVGRAGRRGGLSVASSRGARPHSGSLRSPQQAPILAIEGGHSRKKDSQQRMLVVF